MMPAGPAASFRQYQYDGRKRWRDTKNGRGVESQVFLRYQVGIPSGNSNIPATFWVFDEVHQRKSWEDI